MRDSMDGFGQARKLLTEEYRRLSVVLLHADVPLEGRGYFTTHGSSLATLRRYHPVIASLLFLLVDAGRGGRAFDTFVPELPESLRGGEVRRVFWNEQPIALSLHPDPLPVELLYTQKLSAVLAWSSWQGHPQRDLLVSEEARERMSLRDALPLSAFFALGRAGEEGQGENRKQGLVRAEGEEARECKHDDKRKNVEVEGQEDGQREERQI